MPVRIRYKTRYQGSVTPSALNTETNVINLESQPDDYIVEGYISLKNLASGDTVIIRVYMSADGVTQDKSDEMTLSGPVSVPIVRIPATTLPYNGLFRVTVTQTAGTLRAYPYTFIVQVMEQI